MLVAIKVTQVTICSLLHWIFYLAVTNIHPAGNHLPLLCIYTINHLLMRLLLPFLTALCMAANCTGQFNYTYSVKQETYQPLTGGISLNNNTLWDEEFYRIPIGFSFVLDGDTIDSCYVAGPTAIFNDTSGNSVSCFWTILADLYDRGTHNGGFSLSPLSYLTAGVAGNRICKIEIANAGFWDEYDK